MKLFILKMINSFWHLCNLLMTHDFSPALTASRGGITVQCRASADMPAADIEAEPGWAVLTSLIRCVYSVFYLQRSRKSLGKGRFN